MRQQKGASLSTHELERSVLQEAGNAAPRVSTGGETGLALVLEDGDYPPPSLPNPSLA